MFRALLFFYSLWLTGAHVTFTQTLAMNYLPDAKAHGAVMFCNVEVQYLTQLNGGVGWQINCLV
jgi:hypothetical protein